MKWYRTVGVQEGACERVPEVEVREPTTPAYSGHDRLETLLASVAVVDPEPTATHRLGVAAFRLRAARGLPRDPEGPDHLKDKVVLDH